MTSSSPLLKVSMHTAPIPFKYARTAAEFDDALADTKAKIHASRSGCWFRGQRVGAWPLCASLFRPGNDRRREHALFEDFRTRGASLLPQNPKSWTLLYLMQHHGVPTRLLDWTDNLNVALYFALNGDYDQPRVWLLNPYILASITTKGALSPKHATKQDKFIYDLTDDDVLQYYERIVDRRDWPFALPLPIYCRRDFLRIDKQSGFFTVQGEADIHSDARLQRCLQSIELGRVAADQLRARLSDSGMDAFMVHGDLPSLAESLKRKYELR